MYCPNCNNPLNPNQKVCSVCGRPVDGAVKGKKSKPAEPCGISELQYNDDYENSELSTLDLGTKPSAESSQASGYYSQPQANYPPVPPQNNQPEQSSATQTKLLVLIIILLSVLLVGGGVFTAIMLVNGGGKSSSAAESSQSSSQASKSESSDKSGRKESSEQSSREESSRQSSREESSRQSSREESSRQSSSDIDDYGITLEQAKRHTDELEEAFLEEAAYSDPKAKLTDRITLEEMYYADAADYRKINNIVFVYRNRTQNYYCAMYARTSNFRSDGSPELNAVLFLRNDDTASSVRQAKNDCLIMQQTATYDITKLK